MEVRLFRQGRLDYEPVSHVCFRGHYHEVSGQGVRYVTDLNGALKWVFVEDSGFIFEEGILFRRTIGGRWLLYDGSLYSEAYGLTGRHYVPIPIESSDPRISSREKGLLKRALDTWDRWVEETREGGPKGPSPFLTTGMLQSRDLQLRRVLKATVPIVPPEAIFVDYDLIPVVVADGCVANCSFCCVKTGGEFMERPLRQIREAIGAIRAWLGEDCTNFSTIFLGQNDALFVDTSLLVDAAHCAYERLGLERSSLGPSGLMMFGSPLALLQKKMSDFRVIDALPFEKIHINMGVESLDPGTIRALGRPFDGTLSLKALERLQEVHATTKKIEISVNFVLGPGLGCRHMELLEEFLEEGHYGGKGCVYISPLVGAYDVPGQVKREVFRLKTRSRWPLFLYGLAALL